MIANSKLVIVTFIGFSKYEQVTVADFPHHRLVGYNWSEIRDRRFIICGGIDPDNRVNTFSTTVCYKSDKSLIKECTSMNHPRRYHGMTTYKNSSYVFGGVQWNN